MVIPPPPPPSPSGYTLGYTVRRVVKKVASCVVCTLRCPRRPALQDAAWYRSKVRVSGPGQVWQVSVDGRCLVVCVRLSKSVPPYCYVYVCVWVCNVCRCWCSCRLPLCSCNGVERRMDLSTSDIIKIHPAFLIYLSTYHT